MDLLTYNLTLQNKDLQFDSLPHLYSSLMAWNHLINKAKDEKNMS